MAAAAIGALPTSAQVPVEAPLARLPVVARGQTEAALDRVARLRRTMTPRTSFETRVRGILRAGGTPVPASLPVPGPTAADRRSVRRLPRGTRRPVAQLAAATRDAVQRLGRIPDHEARAELAALIAAMAAEDRGRLKRAQEIHNPLTGETVGRIEAPRMAGRMGRLGPATRHAVRAHPAVLMELARALDRALPALERHTHGARAAETAPACDLLDQSPWLCVSSDADNLQSTDEVLTIDLGGDDTYTHGSGAAPFPAGPGGWMPLSLALDLGGGADTYAPERLDPQTASSAVSIGQVVMGSGAGAIAGIGILVDDGGDDVHAATAAPPAPWDQQTGYSYSTVVAQGAGAVGAGLLFDLDGNDTYGAATPTTTGRNWVQLFAQGAGSWYTSTGCQDFPATDRFPSCSYGALVDLGGGHDSYGLDLGGYRGGVHQGSFSGALGQGAATITLGNVSSTGLLFDDGGDGEVSATAELHDLEVPPTNFGGAFAELRTQASALGEGAQGLLVTGSGSTHYAMRMTAEGAGAGILNELLGQAGAAVGGDAVLSDAGGDDTFDLHGRIDSRPRIQAPPCNDPCTHTSDSFHPNTGGFAPIRVLGQGYGGGFLQIGGLGVLDVGGGTTRFSASDVAELDAQLTGAHGTPDDPATFEAIGFLSPFIQAQGVGYGGVGVLLNHGGSATYDLLVRDAVHAAAHGESSPRASAISPFMQFAAGQGAAYWNAAAQGNAAGALLDLGGSGDVFSARQEAPASVGDGAAGAFELGAYWPVFQGAGQGGVLVATGDAPTISSSPTNGVCPLSDGPRGSASWLECQTSYSSYAAGDADHRIYDYLGGFLGFGRSIGRMPESSVEATTLTLTRPPPPVVYEGTTVPVELAVTDAGGAPVAGVPVHATLQFDFGGTPAEGVHGPLWYGTMQVDGVTGDDGRAALQLPIGLRYPLGVTERPVYPFQVLTTADQVPGHAAAHVATPIALSYDAPPPEPPISPTPTPTPDAGADATPTAPPPGAAASPPSPPAAPRPLPPVRPMIRLTRRHRGTRTIVTAVAAGCTPRTAIVLEARRRGRWHVIRRARLSPGCRARWSLRRPAPRHLRARLR